MLSTIKSDPDWEGHQIEIKYENIIPEYLDIKEIKEESGDSQEFEIKIEKCSVNEELEDLPQEYIRDGNDLNESDHENFDCSDNKCFNGSIGVMGTKDSLEWQYSEYNCDDATNMGNHGMVALNRENEYSAHQNIPSFQVSHTSNTSEITSESNVNRKRKKVTSTLHTVKRSCTNVSIAIMRTIKCQI